MDVTFKSLKQIHDYLNNPVPVHLTDKPKAHLRGHRPAGQVAVPRDQCAQRRGERVVRLLRIMGEVERMYNGKSENAARWMKTPKRALGNIAPLKAVVSERGASRVSHLIAQTMHGVVY